VRDFLRVIADLDKPSLIATVLGLLIAVVVFQRSRREYRRWGNPIDLAMCMVACIWLFHLVGMESLRLLSGDQRAIQMAASIRNQALTIAVAMLLVGVSRTAKSSTYRYLLLQMAAGCAALTWNLVAGGDVTVPDATWSHWVWILINLTGTLALGWALFRRARADPTASNWLAVAGMALTGVLWADALGPQDADIPSATFTHLFYGLCLTFVWYLSKLPAGNSPLHSSGFAPTTGFDMLPGFSPGNEEMTRLISHERRRIANDLHDNVGSQLVNILASLKAPGAAVDPTLSVALEQCLMDLKMTVDAIDSANDNVPEALGRVRQRVQLALDALGIQMAWRVQMCEQLEAARGPIAVQILRIAQEALSNIIRHSGATAVEVACRYDPKALEIILEIYDNGRGIAPNGQHGRPGHGLDNMRQRAAALDGQLFISSKARKGTHLRLSIPFDKNGPRWQRAGAAGPSRGG
jgi:signal transduction histidine kinase